MENEAMQLLNKRIQDNYYHLNGRDLLQDMCDAYKADSNDFLVLQCYNQSILKVPEYDVEEIKQHFEDRLKMEELL